MGGANSKLKPKHMHKIGMRFIEMYKLEIGKQVEILKNMK